MRALTIAVTLAAACSARGPVPEEPAATEETFSGAWSPPPRPGAEVVAQVGDAQIYGDEVARQMAATDSSAREALDQLIAAELLAAEARRRGLADDPEVIDTRRRERVRALLRRDFEPSFDGPEDVPQAEVEGIYRMPNINALYEHDAIRTVAYVRFPVKKTPAPGEDATAHAAAAGFYALLLKERPATKQAFFAAAHKLPPGAPVESSDKQTFKTTLDGPAVAIFAKAAFSIARPAEVARPVRTEWGWDVLYLDEVTAELHTPQAEAFADIRRRRFEAARRMAFQKWMDGLASRAKVQRHDELLENVQVDSLIGTP